MAPEYKYREGPQARQTFDGAMKAIFQAPKAGKVKRKKRVTTRKSKGSDKG